MFALLLPAILFSISHSVTAQDTTAMTRENNTRRDSLANAYDQAETAKEEQKKNTENLSDLRAEQKETKAKAREAQRVEREANNAARESKAAYRMEMKAQKAREQANKQAKKAAKARTKSEQN